MIATLPVRPQGFREITDDGGRTRAADSGRVASVRTELLAALFERMNAAGIPYCVLNGFEGYPEVIASDVDFMVGSGDLGRTSSLLLEVARCSAAMLVQSIRHETGACYFVLAKQVGGEVAYLHPDCSTDYRRTGRLWLAAAPVLERRKPYKAFFVPAVADQFQYYLLKKVLKQQISGAQLHRLAALYTRCPEECSQRIRRVWSKKTTGALVSALVRQDIGWTRSHLPALLTELRASAPVESWWKRSAQHVREWQRWVERVMNPAGLSICLSGGNRQQRDELATALERNLRPAFRRTRIVGEHEARGPRLAASLWLAKVRSTLVIRHQAVAPKGWWTRDEICFVVSDATMQSSERATRVALQWMAERLRRRLRLALPPGDTSMLTVRES